MLIAFGEHCAVIQSPLMLIAFGEHCAASGTRTRTTLPGQGILSPSCLPIPPLRPTFSVFAAVIFHHGCKGTSISRNSQTFYQLFRIIRLLGWRISSRHVSSDHRMQPDSGIAVSRHNQRQRCRYSRRNCGRTWHTTTGCHPSARTTGIVCRRIGSDN